MKKIKVIKLEERTDAEYPNNIPVDMEKIGIFIGYPRVGEAFIISKENGGVWMTSTVTSLLSFDTFKTKNSVYKIVSLEDESASDINVRTNSPINVKTVQLPDGDYKAFWSGYGIRIPIEKDIIVETSLGCKGINVPIMVKIESGNLTILEK